MDVCKKEPIEEPVSEQEKVQLELENFNNRWDSLSTDVKEFTTQLENTEEELAKVNEKEKVLDDLLSEVEKILDDQKPIQTNPTKCTSNLEQVKVYTKLLNLSRVIKTSFSILLFLLQF